VTAAALYDGHDAAINIIRRGLVAQGAEVIHLGHNRSALEVAKAAVEEDASAVAVSSYQGGHEEFFPYLRQLLDGFGAAHIAIFGGGGGVILEKEIEALEKSGVEKIFTPEDGRRLGLEGMVRQIIERARERAGVSSGAPIMGFPPEGGSCLSIARAITRLERGEENLERKGESGVVSGGAVVSGVAVVLGVTGTGGAGKSSLVDELSLRIGRDSPSLRMGILAVDPTKRRTGGALLGDRLRMNSIYRPQVYFRSLATRGSGSELAPAVAGAISVLSRAGFGLVIVETSGIGQGSSKILDVSDLTLYVMTADFGAPTQLEKIDMLDFADLVAVNKADRRGAEDATRMVKRQVGRSSREPAAFVIATCASRFNDAGVSELYGIVVERLKRAGCPLEAAGGRIESSRSEGKVPARSAVFGPNARIIPPFREHYLSEAAEAVRLYRKRAAEAAGALRELDSLVEAKEALSRSSPPPSRTVLEELEKAALARRSRLSEVLAELEEWERLEGEYRSGKATYRVRDRDIPVELHRKTLSGLNVPRVSLPSFQPRSELLRFLREENVPGRFPFTGGVFPFKREDELPTRQFAGEGPPERTNRRFHLLCDGLPAKRLSVAFDSVTLYGEDPDERPDIYGKIGTSGVSIATLDDMRKLFRGFDLLDASTSVSMTINGPAPMILAMFLNAAMDQQADRLRSETRREPSAEEWARIKAQVLENIRGTVQADILKEDQAQNTCIFSTEFALKMMGDVEEYFIEKKVRNYYSISISGYHIAEAGANPITQLAFTLANGFTYLEFFKHRGMQVDDFAPSFSFFFSNGLDAEYSVLGRVARRIWAVCLRDLYGASERSQKLKYHIQTSGRSLHSREIAFNDIRTTLQALLAVYDNCNSLHTNAYDEAITTPTEESVRRALAIQLIVQKELGVAQNENPLQGSFIFRELTDLVEEAVLQEFDRISERGGVLGAMETGYLRNRIQEESLLYEELKHSGKLPIVGVNTFLEPKAERANEASVPVVRSTEEEKRQQIRNVREFQERNKEAGARALESLRETALGGGNLFAELMETVRHASLGQITKALSEVGGRYRRSL
jgi:methylmalonyl-CoA mutase